MEQWLIVYDTTGYILDQKQGNVREPVGIPFLWIEVPVGKMLTGIDVSVTPNVPIFTDYPKTEIELLKEQVVSLQEAIDIMTGGTTNE
jgi:hypothetical protein